MAQESQPGLPRWFEWLAAAIAILVLGPLMVVIGLLVRLTSSGPILFRQERVGRNGQPFELLKFRSMTDSATVTDSDGPSPNTASGITASGDQRVTGLGRVLRASKLDELPELLNILRGDMSIVGPRPEVPTYVDLQDSAWRRVLAVRPGLTDPVTLLLRNEEEILRAGAEQTGLTVEDFYRQHLLPFKLERSALANTQRTALGDIGTAIRTAAAIVGGGAGTRAVLAMILEQDSD